VLLIVSNGRAAVNRGKRKAGSPLRTQRKAKRFTAKVAKNAKKKEKKGYNDYYCLFQLSGDLWKYRNLNVFWNLA
jgi:hypothetical protein